MGAHMDAWMTMRRDLELRQADRRVVRCERCGSWSWQYPRCVSCRTRHQRGRR